MCIKLLVKYNRPRPLLSGPFYLGNSPCFAVNFLTLSAMECEAAYYAEQQSLDWGKMKRSLLFTLFLLASCANPLNLHTANEYFQGGRYNAAQGKWFNARMAFGRAWTNAELGNAEDRVKAVYAYEYGRASGVICDWVESERGLSKALELDKKTNGLVYMSLIELARMYHAKSAFEESRKYFDLGKNALDKVQADTRDSIGYANILGEYAEVLSKLGSVEEAKALRKREEEIRSVFKGRTSGHEQTPYGQHCDQKSLAGSSMRTLLFEALV